ncbi:hypothetical protein E3C22_08240 [Jiella endophytica]|uniref:Uncharacterized protein n=1 Tax=Jiella endophytica TaxID=2558362 RepID=A0A4Y8RQJ3_9HYPH|nr:hypothetical protein [Jiella endophytica]TFF25340.1 hypothetical protein E3C22_08240 [Jiella endophytica]
MTLLLVLVFFTPLAAVYGRYRARVLLSEGTNLGQRLLRLAPLPTVVLAALIVAVEARSVGPMGTATPSPEPAHGSFVNAALSFVGTILHWIGDLSLILFFLSIPYVIGSMIAAGLLILDARGEITLTPLAVEAEEAAQ